MATFGGRPLIDHYKLEEYADPVAYDRQDSSDTGVAFYAALAQETGGPVLEIACGTGRATIPIARRGFAVTGLDVVPGMLERARSKAAGLPIRWVEGDARDFDLGEERFRLIFLTGNAFQAFLTNADQEALLGRVRTHLHDEGLFAFETRNPRWRTREHRDENLDGLFVYLETRAEEEALPPHTDAHGREVREWRTRAYDHAAQVLHWTSRRRWREGAQERTETTRTHQQRALFTVRLRRRVLRTSPLSGSTKSVRLRPMAVLPTGRVGYASPAVGSGVRGEVLSWSPRYGDGTARPAAYTGGEGAPCRQRKERRVDDGGGFVSLRFREPRDRLSARGSHGVQLLNVPALRRPVGLLLTAAGARVAP